MELDFSVIFDYKAALLFGLLLTLKLTAICVILSCALGFIVAIARSSKNKIIYGVSTVYVALFRGTPVLIQLFWMFFCLPLVLGVELSNLTCGIIALTLYMAAITSETFRASFSFVSKEQHDAGVALGLTYRVHTLYVLLPQALLRAAPTLLSNCTSLFKESALVSAVGMADLMFVSQNISNRTGHPVELLTAAAVIYFVIAFPITRAVTALERKILHTMAI